MSPLSSLLLTAIWPSLHRTEKLGMGGAPISEPSQLWFLPLCCRLHHTTSKMRRRKQRVQSECLQRHQSQTIGSSKTHNLFNIFAYLFYLSSLHRPFYDKSEQKHCYSFNIPQWPFSPCTMGLGIRRELIMSPDLQRPRPRRRLDHGGLGHRQLPARSPLPPSSGDLALQMIDDKVSS